MPDETKHRVVVLGGGFGGVFTAKHLRRRARSDVEVMLISRHNFFVFQPLLAEIAGGSINPSDGVTPLRRFLPGVAVTVAEVIGIDLAAKTVRVTLGRASGIRTIPYDQLVIALGQVVDLSRTPGLADAALVMKDVMDAFSIRNQVLGCLECADSATDARRKRSLLTFVVIGGGFTGIETIGEVHGLIGDSLKYYPNIRADEIRVMLIQHGSRILMELPEHLARYAADQLRRRGIEIHLDTSVKAATATGIDTDCGLSIDAETIIAASGNAPSPVVRALPVAKARGRIVVDRHLRVPGQNGVWALGDNALIPLGDVEDGTAAFAPPLAQFAFREAKVMARNILAQIDGRPLTAFEYKSLGTMASLGGRRGVAEIMGVRITGFFAWAAWRVFYLALLPGVATRIRVAVDWLLDLVLSKSIAEFRRAQPGSGQVRFRAGELVVVPGIDPGGLYVVTAGLFEIGIDREHAGPTRKLGPGDHFGMPLDGTTGAGDVLARACEDSMAYFVGKDDLHRLAMVAALIGSREDGDATTRIARTHEQ